MAPSLLNALILVAALPTTPPMTTPVPTRPLIRHPQATCAWVQALEAGAEVRGRALHLSYVIRGDLAHLRIPVRGGLARGERLWEHTCLEAFVALGGGATYREFNFSPSRAWAAQGFRAYREREDWGLDQAPAIEVDQGKDTLRMDVRIPLDGLFPGQAKGPWRVALAAVIEAEDGTRTHWALHHTSAERPDFHRAESFQLTLP